MSDAVTDIEIEDVLSSIRRLVGDEHRVKPRPEVVELPSKPTRLVLTPSLLVPVPDTPKIVPEPEVNTEAEEAPEADVPAVDTLVLEPEAGIFGTTREMPADDVDDLPLKVDFTSKTTPLPAIENGAEIEPETTPEFVPEFRSRNLPDSAPDFLTEKSIEPISEIAASTDVAETSDLPAWAVPDSTLFEAGVVDLDSDDGSDDMEALNFDDTDVTPEDQFGADNAVVSTATEIAASEDFFLVPDESLSEDLPIWADEISVAAKEDANGQDLDVGTNHQDQDIFGDPEDDTPYNTATLSSKIAALEAKIGQTQDQWEPDGGSADDYAGTEVGAIEWEDHDSEEMAEDQIVTRQAEEDIAEQASEQVASTSEPQNESSHTKADTDDHSDVAFGLAADDEALLDEESLRELVADIVRQELQGALGERITRNVRKLVRREIQRALTAQELD